MTYTDASAAYLDKAAEVAVSRADCLRREIGAVLVLGGRVISSGANHVPGDSCTHGGCPRGQLTTDELPAYASYISGPGRCYAVHAEVDAIHRLAVPSDADGATLYVSARPCDGCRAAIGRTGIALVVWPTGRWVPEK